VVSLIQDGNDDFDLKLAGLFTFADTVTSITAILRDHPSSNDPGYRVAVSIVNLVPVRRVRAQSTCV
jgi:hypothetical protein